MRFHKIKSTENIAAFEWTEEAGKVKHGHSFESKERPAPELPNALNAFRPYVVDLLGLPEPWSEALTISSISLSEDEDGRRGLIVTAVKKVERAHGNPVVINTPLMRERGESDNASNGFFDEDIAELIEAAELAAEDYVVHGKRLDISMFTPEQIAEMERKANENGGKKKRPKGRKLGDGQFVEDAPPPGEPLTDEVLRQLVATVGFDLPVDAIAQFTSSERSEVQRWAEQAQKDVAAGGEISRIPPVVARHATPPLIKDDLATAGKAEPRKRFVHRKAGDDGRARPKGKR